MLRSSLIVTLISIGTYLFSFLNQLLVAHIFGASAQLDIYLGALSVPFLVMTVANGAFSYYFVPFLVPKRLHTQDYSRFSGLLFVVVLIIAVLIPGLAFFASPFIVQVLMPTYAETLQRAAVEIARISWLTCGLSMVVGYLVSLHNAARQFFTAAAVGMLPYLGMILFLLGAPGLGPLALVFGMLIGNALAIPLLVFGIRREFSFDAEMYAQWREIRVATKQLPSVLFFMVCLSIYPTIDAFWATRLGVNNLSYLGYGQKILVAFCNVILLGPMVVIHPYLSAAAAGGQLREFRFYTLRALKMIFFFLSIIVATVSLLSVPIVKALFEHGAFDHTMTLAVSAVIPAMSLGVMAMILVVLLLRVFFAKGDVTGASRLGGAGALLYFSLSGLFSAVFGLQGIVLAYVITWLMLLSWAVHRLWKSHGQEILNAGNLTYLRHLAAALVFCTGLIWLGDKYLIKPAMDAGAETLLLNVALTSALGLAGFLLLTLKWFKMEEATLLFQALPFGRKGRPCGS